MRPDARCVSGSHPRHRFVRWCWMYSTGLSVAGWAAALVSAKSLDSGCVSSQVAQARGLPSGRCSDPARNQPTWHTANPAIIGTGASFQ